MHKFCIDKKRLDLTKYKRLQIFNDIFQFVWSGEYDEDIPYSLSDNDKLGYLPRVSVDINLDEDCDDIEEYLIDYRPVYDLFKEWCFIIPLNLTYGEVTKHFQIEIYIDILDERLGLGVPLYREDLKRRFTKDNKDILTISTSLYAELGDYDTKVINILKFDYYKLRKE